MHHSEWDSVFGRGFNGVRRLQNELNRVFDQRVDEQEEDKFPLVNLFSAPDKVIATMELPGVDVGSLDLTVCGKNFTVKGERKPEQMSGSGRYLRRERGFGEFGRTIELPFVAEPNAVEASLRHGILSVVFQPAQSEKAKKINIASQ